MAHVGFIGLGIMGDPMCRNLIAAGHDVTVYNRSREKMAPLVAAGDAAGVPTPVTAAAHQLFSVARERGFGDHDISAVLRALTAR